MKYQIGQWLMYQPDFSECQIVESFDFWETPNYRIWIPLKQAMVVADESQLIPLDQAQNLDREPDRLLYLASVTKLAQILEQASRGEELLSPIQSNLVPLPHQIVALRKVLSAPVTRFLLADEVGLGKTIEAGMVMKELKLRGVAKRILVVVPKGLVVQWDLELRLHFNEHFQIINGEDISSLDRLFASDGGTWKIFDQVLVSLDSIKPIVRRRGWSKERLDEYNRTRLGNLLKAKWDLIIIDEAHRIGGSTEQVARYKLGKALAEITPSILLLSATPHQGKSDAFFRLLNILDPHAFPEPDAVNKERVQQYLVRTEKRNALNDKGLPLFQPRITKLHPVSWDMEYDRHKELYEAVSSYVRFGYNKALKNKKPHVGFLMVLLQRLVTSSTLAIKTTLERRLDVLKRIQEEEQDAGLLYDIEELEELDGEQQQEVLIESSGAMFNEIATVESLLELATRCLHEREDAKVVELRNLITQLEQQEQDPGLKVLVFTEFVPTQTMLREYFEQRGFEVVLINGSMGRDERQVSQTRFEQSARMLISTDAGGEGLNLQVAHVVVNYDLPWNPMKIEQRIGRVDRIGQTRPVNAINLLLLDTVEYRVIEVLEDKLRIVADELGIDKTSDVLETSESAALYQAAITNAVMNPEKAENTIEQAIKEIKAENMIERDGKALLSSIQMKPTYDEIRKLQESLVPFWTENAVLGYLRYMGGSAVKSSKGWSLNWPDGTNQKFVGFQGKEQPKQLLSTASPKVLQLIQQAPDFHIGSLIPHVVIEGLPIGVSGICGVFSCKIQSSPTSKKETYIKLPREKELLFPLFFSSEGKLFPSTAQRVWLLLAASKVQVLRYKTKEDSISYAQILFQKAKESAVSLLEEYRNELEQSIQKELDRLVALEDYQSSRIDKTPLNEVRHYRQARLALFNEAVEEEIHSLRHFHPSLSCKLIVSLGG
ncbi:MAG: DEAD/DEAH box helicase [Firmicutes bacterium]|jgi:superfamily II DNA or RNA helicase|nr:DEAD/DEAH box helicase [Bacillota bacterium]